MKKRTNLILLLTSLCASLFMLASCGTPKPEKLIKNGDYVTAIESLAQKLTKKPGDQKSADAFSSIYKMTLQQKNPEQSVEEIILTYIPNYNSNPVSELKKIAKNLGSGTPLSNDSGIDTIIKRSENTINSLYDAIRIQNAVMTMPPTIGNQKKGSVYSVEKSDENFTGRYNKDVLTFGQFYYNLGEALYPGKDIREKEEALGYYTNANSYVNDIANVKNRGADLCYQIADEYIARSNSIENKKSAISWYAKSLTWVSNYKDSQTMIYKLNYEIAMTYKATAKTIADYENVLTYLGNAGTYKDAVQQKNEITYSIALAYKEDLTDSSYNKAGSYFKSLGNYENAENESRIYDFYKKLINLDKTARLGSIQLTSGKSTNQVTHNVEKSEAEYTNLDVITKFSSIPVFAIIKDGSISPGAMIEGTSIVNSNFKPFSYGDREQLKYVINGGSKWTQISDGTIKNPATRSAHLDIVSEAYGISRKIDPITSYEITQIFSQEDLDLTLGNGVDKSSVSLGNNLRWSDNVVLVKITQKYFGASIEPPKMPYQFFSADGNSPVRDSNLSSISPYYIDSVDYGRVGYFVFSTQTPFDDFKSDVKTIIEKEGKNSSFIKTATKRWSATNTRISGLSVAEKAYSINTFEKWCDWIKVGETQDLSIDYLPPISFTMRCLSNNNYGTLYQSSKIRIQNPNYVEPVYEPTVNPIEPTNRRNEEPISTGVKVERTNPTIRPTRNTELAQVNKKGNELAPFEILSSKGKVYKCSEYDNDGTYVFYVGDDSVISFVWDDSAKIDELIISNFLFKKWNYKFHFAPRFGYENFTGFLSTPHTLTIKYTDGTTQRKNIIVHGTQSMSIYNEDFVPNSRYLY